MKTKKHFYAGRIKVLSLAFVFLFAGLLVSGVASAQGTVKAKIENLGKTGGLGIVSALVPFAIVKDMKAKGKWDSLDEATQNYLTSLEESINKSLNSITPGLTEPEIEAKHKEWMKTYGKGLTPEQETEFKNAMQSIKDQATEIQRMKDTGVGSDAIKSLIAQMKERDTEIKAFKAAGKGNAGKLTFELKAVATQAATDIATHTISERAVGIGQIPVRKPFMKDLFTWIPISKEYIKYLDQETVVRDAKNYASGSATSHTTKLTWKERTLQITNVRDLVNVPIDMLDDYDFVEGELRNLLDVNVQLKIDSGLLTGDGVHPNLNSVNAVASDFSAANTLGGTIAAFTGTVKDPNIFDLVICMTAQIIALGKDNGYLPNVVLFNTIDRYKSLMNKNANGDYILPPFVARIGNKEYNIDGMVVRSNPEVPANSVYVFDSTKATGYMRKNAVAEISYENASNFETETATLKVYERLNLLIRNTNKNAFMRCLDVETALAAIKKA